MDLPERFGMGIGYPFGRGEAREFVSAECRMQNREPGNRKGKQGITARSLDCARDDRGRGRERDRGQRPRLEQRAARHRPSGYAGAGRLFSGENVLI